MKRSMHCASPGILNFERNRRRQEAKFVSFEKLKSFTNSCRTSSSKGYDSAGPRPKYSPIFALSRPGAEYSIFAMLEAAPSTSSKLFAVSTQALLLTSSLNSLATLDHACFFCFLSRSSSSVICSVLSSSIESEPEKELDGRALEQRRAIESMMAISPSSARMFRIFNGTSAAAAAAFSVIALLCCPPVRFNPLSTDLSNSTVKWVSPVQKLDGAATFPSVVQMQS
mmetsp:Transcript_7778/g.22544  ORF Transcript_7778/g.22544 Transcript_7778/m.22544 type:complete len:226 (+) Transcript_7778:2777-3454(+)